MGRPQNQARSAPRRRRSERRGVSWRAHRVLSVVMPSTEHAAMVRSWPTTNSGLCRADAPTSRQQEAGWHDLEDILDLLATHLLRPMPVTLMAGRGFPSISADSRVEGTAIGRFGWVLYGSVRRMRPTSIRTSVSYLVAAPLSRWSPGPRPSRRDSDYATPTRRDPEALLASESTCPSSYP